MKTSYEYQERIVVLLDILGFKSLVNDESRCEEIGTLLKMPYILEQIDIQRFFKIKGLTTTSISDSLVFSVGLKERAAMDKSVKLITVFVQTLLSHKFLVRGGIAIGKLYHDANIVYGPGLVKAYNLEKYSALYPRVIMMASDFERAILSCGKITQEILRKMFTLDIDGFLALDCFYHKKSREDLYLYLAYLEQMTHPDVRVQQKINWMKSVIENKLQNLSNTNVSEQ